MHRTDQESQLWTYLGIEVDQDDFTTEEAEETVEEILDEGDKLAQGFIRWDDSDKWVAVQGTGRIISIFVDTPLWDGRFVTTELLQISIN